MNHINEYRFWNKDSDIGDNILKKIDNLKKEDISGWGEGLDSTLIAPVTYSFNLNGFVVESGWKDFGFPDVIGKYTLKIDGVKLSVSRSQARKIFKKVKSIYNDTKNKKENDDFIIKDARISLREGIKKFEDFTMGDDICDICGGQMFNKICENCENEDNIIEIPKEEKDKSHYNSLVPQTTRSQNIYYENNNSNLGYIEMDEVEFNSKVYNDTDTGWINGYEDEDDYSTIDYIKSKWDSFTDLEILKLNEYFEDIQDMLSYGEGWENKEMAIGIPKMSKIYVSDNKYWNPNSIHLLIIKLKDEWYYVKDETYDGKYYKCDQFENLISLVKKIINDKSIQFESFSMNKDICDRCNMPTNGVTIMSMYNQDIICENCKNEEKLRDDYKIASEIDNMEIRKGNYNFKGIGYSKNENVDYKSLMIKKQYRLIPQFLSDMGEQYKNSEIKIIGKGSNGYLVTDMIDDFEYEITFDTLKNFKIEEIVNIEL